MAVPDDKKLTEHSGLKKGYSFLKIRLRFSTNIYGETEQELKNQALNNHSHAVSGRWQMLRFSRPCNRL